jgi:hypothetical protein
MKVKNSTETGEMLLYKTKILKISKNMQYIRI